MFSLSFWEYTGSISPLGFSPAELTSNAWKMKVCRGEILIDVRVVIFGIYGGDFPPYGSPQHSYELSYGIPGGYHPGGGNAMTESRVDPTCPTMSLEDGEDRACPTKSL